MWGMIPRSKDRHIHSSITIIIALLSHVNLLMLSLY